MKKDRHNKGLYKQVKVVHNSRIITYCYLQALIASFKGTVFGLSAAGRMVHFAANLIFRTYFSALEKKEFPFLQVKIDEYLSLFCLVEKYNLLGKKTMGST